MDKFYYGNVISYVLTIPKNFLSFAARKYISNGDCCEQEQKQLRLLSPSDSK